MKKEKFLNLAKEISSGFKNIPLYWDGRKSILEMKEAGFAPLRLEGTHRSGWLVADFGDVIFHVFRETAREFYDLDRLWADAPEVPENHIPALRGIHPDG